MSLFNPKRKIINTATADLRNYTATALKQIKIINAATIILPENPDYDFMEAYGNITLNTAQQIYLSANRKIIDSNGILEITESNSNSDDIINSNGIVLVHSFESEKPIDIISNGIVVFSKKANVNIIFSNGVSVSIPFEINDTKMFPNKANIGMQFFENIKERTVICCGNELRIDDDVDLETLKQKEIFIASGNSIKCSSDIIGYVQTISIVGNKISSYD